MFKYFALFVIIGCALASPEPEAKPVAEAKAAPKPGVLAYSAPLVAPGLAYTAAYTAPLAYSAYAAPYVAPYAAAYSAYAPYSAFSAPLVVV
ncbi:hypothetical protein HHI36_020412 [Cryptolaemus montrouzieri]|uniref:Uncharacterized protein n=1 Tax=Cryptolaemus montrouzieri TaxID=559131 RepID=A0ABD2NBD4_9CUCU